MIEWYVIALAVYVFISMFWIGAFVADAMSHVNPDYFRGVLFALAWPLWIGIFVYRMVEDRDASV